MLTLNANTSASASTDPVADAPPLIGLWSPMIACL